MKITNMYALLTLSVVVYGIVYFKFGFYSTDDASCRHIIGFIYSPLIFIH
jgi:hypothetical protein